MSVYLVKHSAQGFDNGYGAFLSCEKRSDWAKAGNEAMMREYAERAVRHSDGKAIQYLVSFEPIENQEAFDAYRDALWRAPVVNVYD